MPENMAPIIVPSSAIDTVKPSSFAVRLKTWVSCCVVPAMTAVSNPKSKPPSAPTTMLRINKALSLVLPPG